MPTSTVPTTTNNVAETGEETSAPPLRPNPKLGLGAALLGEEEEALVLDVLRRKEPFRYYGLDPQNPPPMAATLEQEFREMVGTQFALAVTSGTAALEVALGALGVGPGDEVIVAAWSWVSCFTSIVRLGALPVLAEIDESFCLAPGEITRLSNERTKAVIIVHYQGVAADMEPLMQEATVAGIKVLEDCAESCGALYRSQRIGSIGDIGIFSFQYSKTMTCGEGGMVVTNNALLYERAVRMHDIGQVRAHHQQFITPQVTPFCGSQFRISEMQVAVALGQLRKVDLIRNHCRALQTRLLDAISDLPGIDLRRIPDPEGDSGIEVYMCFSSPDKADNFRQRLAALNVNCNKVTGTYCHYAQDYCRYGQAHTPAASPFKELSEMPAPGYRQEDFPITSALAERFVALPIAMPYTEEDIDYMAACIKHVHRETLGSQ